MRVIVTVKDRRTHDGLNTRAKNVNSIEEAVEFAKNVKNKLFNEFTLMEATKCIRVKL